MHETTGAFYTRQVCLKEVGQEGQQKLSRAKVLVIGAGGLGCPVLQYLVAAGVGEITICDADIVAESNLHRQPIFSYAQIGQQKAIVAAEHCQQRNPFIRVNPLCDRFTLDNAENLVTQYDLVLDCTDNFSSMFLIHDACYLNSVDLVQANIYQFEGQVQHFPFGSVRSGCLNCLWPTIPDNHCVGNCAQVGVLGSVAGVLGTIQANVAILHLLDVKTLPTNTTWTLDLLTMVTKPLTWKHNLKCKLCSEDRQGLTLAELHVKPMLYFQLTDLRQLSSPYVLVDIRETTERIADPVDASLGSKHFPFSTWGSELPPTLAAEHFIVLFCQSSTRSDWLAKKLIDAGYDNIYSLQGGIAALQNISAEI